MDFQYFSWLSKNNLRRFISLQKKKLPYISYPKNLWHKKYDKLSSFTIILEELEKKCTNIKTQHFRFVLIFTHIMRHKRNASMAGKNFCMYFFLKNEYAFFIFMLRMIFDILISFYLLNKPQWRSFKTYCWFDVREGHYVYFD